MRNVVQIDPSVRYIVRWGRLTEMLALSASASAVIGFILWGG